MDFKPFKIGKYLLLERLATGGMAEVYRAKASGAGGFEKQLAIKRILPNYASNEEFRRMFEYEARLSSMLTHSNIVQIYDFVKSGDTYLLAMEYVDGKNLRQFINKAKKAGIPLPVEFGVYVINEVCKGLEYAHKKKDDLNGRPLNIIHRDMSPQNIMMSYDGAVKIVDFGIAKAKDRVDETRSGVIKGKFGYMSPEQANGEQVDHRTDIFSMGIILWELLTGKRLFAAENDMATLKLIQECVIPAPSRINPKITSELEKILFKTLTKDLKLRYQDAGLCHRSLQEFLNKYFPSFTQKEAGDILQRVFKEEIEQEKKRFEQIYRQSIPFSQGSGDKNKSEDELQGIEDVLDGDITKSGSDAVSAVTFVDNEDEPKFKPLELTEDDLSTANEESTRNSAADDLPLAGTRVGTPLDPEGEGEDASNTEAGTRRESISDLIISNLAEDTNTNNATPTERTKATGEDTLFKDEKMPVLESQKPSTGSGSRGRTNKSQPGDPSGIVLGNSDPNIGTRRRDRSISAITHMSKSGARGSSSGVPANSEISLISVGDATPVRSVDGINGARADYYPERDAYLPPRRRSAFVSFFFFCSILAGTVYLYQLYLEGRVPELVRILSGRVPTNNIDGTETPDKTTDDKIPVPDYTVERRPGGDCTMRIDSDPAGAKVIVDGQQRGETSLIVSGPCNQSANVTLRLDGYEGLSENLVFSTKSNRVYKTLKKIPTGTLELTLNRNATIYIEGNQYAEARAGQSLAIPLRANRKVNVRFVNQIFNIDVSREFTVKEDAVLRESIRLDEPAGRRR